MMFKGFQLFIGAVCALALVACGGGGGSSPVPATPSPVAKGVKLNSGFANVGVSPAGNRHGIARVMRVQTKALPQDVILGSGIVPSADFVVADSYITTAPGSYTQTQLVAYLTTTDGTTTGITSSTIANANVQYTVTSGNPIAIGSPEAVPTAVPSAMPDSGIIIGGAVLTAPTTVGQTMLQVSASVNGTPQTSNNTANSYPGMCLAGPNDDQSYGCIPNAYIDALGFAEPVGSNTADISLSQDANGNTIVNVPNGGAIVNSGVDQVITAPSIPRGAATSFVIDNSPTPAKGTLNADTTLVWNVNGGRVGKWNPTIFAYYGSGTSAGQPEQAYGMYLISASGSTTFAY